MSYKIETHDYGVRLRNARKFVTQGHRVSERAGWVQRCEGARRRRRRDTYIQQAIEIRLRRKTVVKGSGGERGTTAVTCCGFLAFA